MLVLASASPRRRDLMGAEGFPFVVVPSDAEEVWDAESPGLLTETNALLKARAVAGDRRDSVVIGADTLVFLDGRAMGKPADMGEAFEMVARLAGRTHEVITGVALAHAESPLEETFHVISKVTFKALEEGEIRTYLDLIKPLDKAGGYAAQEHGGRIISKIEGPESNVIGLPVERLREVLMSERWRRLWDRGWAAGAIDPPGSTA